MPHVALSGSGSGKLSRPRKAAASRVQCIVPLLCVGQFTSPARARLGYCQAATASPAEAPIIFAHEPEWAMVEPNLASPGL
ncbi:Triosephosphate isomerase [Penicillium sp. IBT 35674x]|nr:Triosephosphate isomerase [Penicillium sp. IBT 35674x]